MSFEPIWFSSYLYTEHRLLLSNGRFDQSHWSITLSYFHFHISLFYLRKIADKLLFFSEFFFHIHMFQNGESKKVFVKGK